MTEFSESQLAAEREKNQLQIEEIHTLRDRVKLMTKGILNLTPDFQQTGYFYYSCCPACGKRTKGTANELADINHEDDCNPKRYE
jgi:hypothetical protein